MSGALALDGAGTLKDPWRIKSLADFNEFAADANYWDDHTRLETDVNLAGQTYTTAVIAPDKDNSNSGFDGIAFTGVFDGNDHKITSLRIDDAGAGNDYLGLFGYIPGGQIMSLGIEGGYVRGDSNVGGLVGCNFEGRISGCYCSNKVIGYSKVGGLVGPSIQGVLSNCYSTGDVNGTDDYVGGLAATVSGIVSNCYSTGNVSGDLSVGGLTGSHLGTVLDCYSGGNVTGRERVGGLVGYNAGSIRNCYSTGDISGDSDVGILVGWNYYMTGWEAKGSISNCFWDTETQTHGISAGIGHASGLVVNVTGLPTSQMHTQSTFTSVGWDFVGESANGTSEVWQMPVSGGYPTLSIFHGFTPLSLAGSGTADDPYLISDANELGMVRWYSEDSCFKLTGDIDLAGVHWSGPLVLRFNGSFDGDGHSLLDVQITGDGPLGAFGYIGEGGEIKNLGLDPIQA